jgi:flagellar biogenesis protein FliO
LTIGLLAQLTGLRDDPIPPFGGSASVGFAQVMQMILALAIVVMLVKWLAPKLLVKFAKKPTTNSGTDIEVQESLTLAGGQVLLINVRGRTLLLGSGLTTLADLTDEQPSPVTGGESDFDKVLERLKRLQG